MPKPIFYLHKGTITLNFKVTKHDQRSAQSCATREGHPCKEPFDRSYESQARPKANFKCDPFATVQE